MKWGLFVTTAQPPDLSQAEVIQRSVKLSVAAEELGFDAVWLLEHHFSRYGLLGSPFGMAGYVLGKTWARRSMWSRSTTRCAWPRTSPCWINSVAGASTSV
jgi:hypothetical protein